MCIGTSGSEAGLNFNVSLTIERSKETTISAEYGRPMEGVGEQQLSTNAKGAKAL